MSVAHELRLNRFSLCYVLLVLACQFPTAYMDLILLMDALDFLQKVHSIDIYNFGLLLRLAYMHF